MFSLIHNSSAFIYNSMYNYIMDPERDLISTPILFHKTLKHILETDTSNIRILDFGCGNGLCYDYQETIDLIKNNVDRLHIVGVDIDEMYIEQFISVLDKNNYNNVKVHLGDVFQYSSTDKFDYVIFTESAPLMDNHFITKACSYFYKNLLNNDGQIIFINNLCENPSEALQFFKPKIKYLTTVDFGRVLTKDDFEEIASILNKKCEFKELVSLNTKDFCKSYKYTFGLVEPVLNKFNLHYDIRQYMISYK